MPKSGNKSIEWIDLGARNRLKKKVQKYRVLHFTDETDLEKWLDPAHNQIGYDHYHMKLPTKNDAYVETVESADMSYNISLSLDSASGYYSSVMDNAINDDAFAIVDRTRVFLYYSSDCPSCVTFKPYWNALVCSCLRDASDSNMPKMKTEFRALCIRDVDINKFPVAFRDAYNTAPTVPFVYRVDIAHGKAFFEILTDQERKKDKGKWFVTKPFEIEVFREKLNELCLTCREVSPGGCPGIVLVTGVPVGLPAAAPPI